MKRILNPNPRKRFTIDQIMMHPWMIFEEGEAGSDEENDDESDEREDVWSQSDVQAFQLPNNLAPG